MLIDPTDRLTSGWRGRDRIWLFFFGWHSFSFCMELIDRRF